MMDCALVREVLPNYLDDELTEELGQQVQAHVIQCRHCAWEVESLRQSAEALRQSTQATRPRAEFRERLREEVLREHRIAQARQPEKPTRAPRESAPVFVLDLNEEVGDV